MARNPDINWITGSIVPRLTPSPGTSSPAICPSLPTTTAASAAAVDEQPTFSTPTPTSKQPFSPIDIGLIDAEAFAKLAYESPILVGAVTPWVSETSASSSAKSTKAEPLAAENLDHIPTCYHDFADVFSKVKADVLPPHRPYDHAIELEPNTIAPFGPIY